MSIYVVMSTNTITTIRQNNVGGVFTVIILMIWGICNVFSCNCDQLAGWRPDCHAGRSNRRNQNGIVYQKHGGAMWQKRMVATPMVARPCRRTTRRVGAKLFSSKHYITLQTFKLDVDNSYMLNWISHKCLKGMCVCVYALPENAALK
eukprot:5124143-Amphidinium_carterae.1